jgi:2-oxoglutarate dehydrogenase E2 component (dihydrolipoamide succinyltransferase)
MAQIEVKVPQLSESVAEATLLTWHKKVGEPVARDENLIDIETDKVVLELPAPAAGVIIQIIKGDGATVVADEVIAIIDTEGRPRSADGSCRPLPRQPWLPPPRTPPPHRHCRCHQGRRGHACRRQDPVRKKACPLATSPVRARWPRDQGRRPPLPPSLPLRHCAAAAKPALQQVAAPAAANLGDRPEERVPMSRLRARIAERLLQSQSTNAILTTFNEVNMQPVMDLRNKYKDKFEKEHGVKLGFMSFFVKAAVAALKKYPIINASVTATTSSTTATSTSVSPSVRRAAWWCLSCATHQMSIADIEKNR